jgi:malto-oligosyltrehalose synthase/4-alpha-glucanotransferase
MFDPITTYRLQFHKGFTFTDFEKFIPYLQKLGVSTIYASPIFKAIDGSTHGYDILEPLELNPEIGTLEQLRAIRQQLKSFNIQWLQDIVPNHMAFHTGNLWLSDVFEKGQRSKFASFFDIDWNHPVYRGRLMVPFFGSGAAELIKNGELKIEVANGQLAFISNGSVYPIKPLSYLTLLETVDGPENLHKLSDNISIIDKEDDIIIYHEKWNDWKQQMNLLLKEDHLNKSFAIFLEKINSNTSLLQRIADEQHYIFCHWQDTNKVINYRRFFTVNALISLNMQDDGVFQYHHQRVKSLLDEDLVQGLRVDHIDGLYNPGEYFQRLRELAGNNTYITVEKILEPDEKLEPAWPIQGTTGYEFLAMVSNLLTEKKSEALFTKFYNNLAKDPAKVPRQVREKKTDILSQFMAGDLDNLYQLFLSLGLAGTERLGHLPGGSLKKAIGSFLVYCPVYRFYGDSIPLQATEADEIQSILHNIKQEEPGLAAAINVLEYVWLEKNDNDDDYNNKAAHFYKRCMQFSGPLMAKGVEDTLMYTFNRLIVHNEVGDAPDAFGSTSETFHQKMKERLQHWPLSLNASSTHDTKRGEDVRARLNALTELPDVLFKNIRNWQELNSELKLDGAPDANDEYFIYQTLIGTYPMPGEADENYAGRLEDYLQKALREAKSHTGWAEPNDAYETATKNFALGLLNKEKPFWKSFKQLHRSIADYGIINSLVQVMLKFTCPGVPDVYQGCELWDLSFVDPDNRRPVDFDQHQKMLESVVTIEKTGNVFNVLWENRFDGRIKLWLVHTLMQVRKQQPEIFSHGAYIPLSVDGEYKENILAFARKLGQTWIVVAVPLQVAALSNQQGVPVNGLNWKDTRITLPKELKGKCQDLLGDFKSKSLTILPVQKLFSAIPLSIIKIDTTNSSRGAGILLHITSLPAAFGMGDFGSEAFSFADFLYRGGQKYWQVLPLNPIEGGQGYSPYSSTSSHAGNILLISPELLAKDGLLSENELVHYHVPVSNSIDYSTAENIKQELLTKAWNIYESKEPATLKKAFNDFIKRENTWLHDYSLYTVLKRAYHGKPWYEWDEMYKHRDAKTLKTLAKKEVAEINKVKWLQFIFTRQWNSLKDYCNRRHIEVIGDIPFYVSYDSADVWSNREIFALSVTGEITGVAGVPPDLFSDDGQLWGMPVFNWDVLKKNNYSWWISRLKKNKELFDIIRLDHFRAFADFWEVPAGETTARLGQWKPGPGEDFFKKMKKQLGTLPFLAEDLGEIDEPVYKLRDDFNFPGMKVLQFGFGEYFPFSEHIPQNYSNRFFAYTGTHDNNTTRGWFRTEVSSDTLENLVQYAGQRVTEHNIHLILAQLAYSSVADTAMLPMQDVLGLDEHARMNTPATGSNNWKWRLLPAWPHEEVEARLRKWMSTYNRG